MLSIDLNNKVAIVTGSTQGIGLGVAKVLADAGCNIAGCGLSDSSSDKVLNFIKEIEERGRKAMYMRVDVKDQTSINAFINSVVDQLGRIDILISNAGRNMFTNPAACDETFWDDNMDLNLKSHWLMSKACYPQLCENKGTVLLMTSNHAYATLPDCFPYNVSKAGITGMVKALAVQWGPKVRVVGLAPGFIQTEGGDKWFESFPDPMKKRQEVENIHLVQKLGDVGEVGAFCAFLCSEFAGFITGTTYLMDGGRSAIMQDV
ncbi:SDR family oxidoreductase [Puteibacter caeruleilacunae]|nr:SDR family oxidoreductase [Puteibacter caeruleilacunae]